MLTKLEEEHLRILFPPGQAKVIKKKLQGKKLNNTEGPVFSRNIKPKLKSILALREIAIKLL